MAKIEIQIRQTPKGNWWANTTYRGYDYSEEGKTIEEAKALFIPHLRDGDEPEWLEPKLYVDTMNREHKYRAWDNNPDLPVDEISERMYNWDDLNDLDKNGLIHLMDVLMGKEPNIIPMQYIGQKDVNGVEIFEDDIDERGYRIMYSQRYFLFCQHYVQQFSNEWVEASYPMDVRRIKIVGNYHQNPELIKQ